MASQIQQLRVQFSNLNTTQQKEFIDKLKQKVQSTNNQDYKDFLNECVQKYNSAVRAGSVGTGQNNLAPTYTPQKNAGGHFSPSVCSYCGEALMPNAKVCFGCGMTNKNSTDVLSLGLAMAGIVLLVPLFLFRFLFLPSGSPITLLLVAIALTASLLGFMIARKHRATKNTNSAYIIGVIGFSLGGIFFIYNLMMFIVRIM